MKDIYIVGGGTGVDRRIAEALLTEGHNVVIVAGEEEILGLRNRADQYSDLGHAMLLALDVMRHLDECWLCSDLFFGLCGLFFMGRHDRPPLEHSFPEHSFPDWDWPALGVHVSQSI